MAGHSGALPAAGDARRLADPGARAEEPLDAAGRRWFDAALLGSIAILAILTLVSLVPGVRLETSNGTLDVVLNTLTAVAAAGAAALAWIRHRIEHEVAAIHESSAFLVLCVTRLLIIGVTAFASPDQLGMSLASAQQWPLYAWSLARFASAGLLVVAASSSLRRAATTRLPTWLLELGPVAGLMVAFVALRSLEGQLPPLLGPSGLAALRGDPGAAPGMEPLGLALQAVIAAIYLLGAWLYRDLFRDRGRRYAGYLAMALVVAGFSQLHWATYPGIYRPLVTVDDLLRALFSVILLLGIESQFRGDVIALRAANARLAALRRRDAERVAIEAGARLARELHDGLSHDLWLAKLAHGRLVDESDLPASARGSVEELGAAIDRALVDARSVVASMRSEAGAVGLGETLQRTVDDFEAQTGIRTEVIGSGVIAALPEPVAGEVVRIVAEALTNVRRHADAATVSVAATATAASIEIRIVDNGRGFDPSSVPRTAFGIRGMRERAELIGADLVIESAVADGTRVILTVPRPPKSTARPAPAPGDARDARPAP